MKNKCHIGYKTLRKGEISCYKQFLLSSQCFPQLYLISASKCGSLVMDYPFPKRQILDSSKLKEFEDDNLKCDEHG